MKYCMTVAVLMTGVWTSLVAAVDKPFAGGDQAKALAEMQKKLIQQFDTNKDGVLSEQEQLAAQEAMLKHGMPPLGMAPSGFPGYEKFLKQFDKDGDGQLSDAEKQMAQAAFQKMRGAGGMGLGKGHHGPHIGGLPGSGLGSMPAMPAGGASGVGGGPNGGNAPDKAKPLIKRFDKDGDGKLNAEEKAAAQAALKAKDKAKDAK